MHKNIFLIIVLAVCSAQGSSDGAVESLRRKHAARKIQNRFRQYRDHKKKSELARQLGFAWQNYDMKRKMRAQSIIRRGLRHGLARRRRNEALLQKLIIDPRHGPAATEGAFALEPNLQNAMMDAAWYVLKNKRKFKDKNIVERFEPYHEGGTPVYLKTEHSKRVFWNGKPGVLESRQNMGRALGAHRVMEWGPKAHAYRVMRKKLPGTEDIVEKNGEYILPRSKWRIKTPQIRIIPRAGTVTPQEAAVQNAKKSSLQKRVMPSPINDSTYMIVEEEVPFTERVSREFDSGINSHGLEQVVTAAKIARTNDTHSGNIGVEKPGERTPIHFIDTEATIQLPREHGMTDREHDSEIRARYYAGPTDKDVYNTLHGSLTGRNKYLARKLGREDDYYNSLKEHAKQTLSSLRARWIENEKNNQRDVNRFFRQDMERRVSSDAAKKVIAWIHTKHGGGLDELLEDKRILKAAGKLRPLAESPEFAVTNSST